LLKSFSPILVVFIAEKVRGQPKMADEPQQASLLPDEQASPPEEQQPPFPNNSSSAEDTTTPPLQLGVDPPPAEGQDTSAAPFGSLTIETNKEWDEQVLAAYYVSAIAAMHF